MISAVVGPAGGPIDAATLASLTAAGSHREGAEPVCELAGGAGFAVSAPATVASLDGATVALDGRIHNRQEVVQALGDGVRPPVSDPLLLLAAFGRWGEDCVSRLVGEFAFALWDGRSRRLVCARDALGVRPLHYTRVGDTLVVASEAQQLLSYPGLSRRPDPVMLAEHLVGLPPDPERSWFESIQAVPPGCLLSADERGQVVRRFWEPLAFSPDRSWDPDETVHRFWVAFRRAVCDRLAQPGQTSGVLLGGGLDSSSVAATAADVLGDRRRRDLVLFNISFDEIAPECDEGRYVAALARSLGMPVRRIAAKATSLNDEWREHPPALESPIAGWQAPMHEILRPMARDGWRVLLTGHGGDAVVAGSAEVYADRLLRGELGVLREMAEHSRHTGARLAGLFRHWVLRPLLPTTIRRAFAGQGVPDWLDGALARRLDLAGRLRQGAPWTGPGSRAGVVIRRQIAGLGSEMRAVHWLGRLAARYGIEIRHPFLDRRLVELALSTPPELLFRAGRYKELLRRALGERLPPLIRDRIGKTSFAPFLEARWRGPGADAIRALLRSSVLAEIGLVRGDRLLREFEAYLQGRSSRLRPYLWAIITAELWLEQHWAGMNGVSRELRVGLGGRAPVATSGS